MGEQVEPEVGIGCVRRSLVERGGGRDYLLGHTAQRIGCCDGGEFGAQRISVGRSRTEYRLRIPDVEHRSVFSKRGKSYAESGPGCGFRGGQGSGSRLSHGFHSTE